jgi:hypothetical protein
VTEFISFAKGEDLQLKPREELQIKISALEKLKTWGGPAAKAGAWAAVKAARKEDPYVQLKKSMLDGIDDFTEASREAAKSLELLGFSARCFTANSWDLGK